MKLIIAIVQSEDAKRLQAAFVDNNVGATKLASTGGFLREGNTTFLLGVEDEDVDGVLKLTKSIPKPEKKQQPRHSPWHFLRAAD